MFATVRELHFVPEQLAAGRAQVQEFTAFFDTRPGFRGQLVVDAGAGRILAMEVWESEAHCLASRGEVEREAGRLMHALLADGPQPGVLGAGEVVYESPGLLAAHA
jgi:Antibiotic biosynthesis monooxygenase